MNRRSLLPVWLSGIVAILLISTVAYFTAENSSRRESEGETAYGTATSSSGGGVAREADNASQAEIAQTGSVAQPEQTNPVVVGQSPSGAQPYPASQPQYGQPVQGGQPSQSEQSFQAGPSFQSAPQRVPQSVPDATQPTGAGNSAIAPSQPYTAPTNTLPPSSTRQYQSFLITTCDGLADGANFRTAPNLDPNTILGVVPAGQAVLLTGRNSQSNGVVWREAVNPNELAFSVEAEAQNQTSANQMGWVADCFVANGF